MFRQDWEELSKRHDISSKAILDVKFSRNGAYLAAASADRAIYILAFSEGEYVETGSRKLEDGLPISV